MRQTILLPLSLFAVFFILSIAGCTSGNKKKGNSIPVQTRGYLSELKSKNPNAGIVVIQVHNDSVSITCTGLADWENKTPVTENTIYEIGSVTKLFTAITAQKLVNRSIIKWNDALDSSLPGVPTNIHDGTLLNNLVSHTAGFPALPAFFTDSSGPVKNPYALVTEEKMLRYLLTCNDKQKPSYDNYNYSNFGMGLLGYILTRKTGKDFERLIKDEISNPLRMMNTGIAVTDSGFFAKGYDKDGNPEAWWNLGMIPGSGGLRSNANDMALFLKACLPGGKLDSLIKPMLQPLGKSPEGSVCYGWQKSVFNETGDVYWHVGGTGGFRSYLGICRERKTGVVVLVNQAIDEIDQVGKKIMLITAR